MRNEGKTSYRPWLYTGHALQTTATLSSQLADSCNAIVLPERTVIVVCRSF